VSGDRGVPGGAFGRADWTEQESMINHSEEIGDPVLSGPAIGRRSFMKTADGQAFPDRQFRAMLNDVGGLRHSFPGKKTRRRRRTP
jgi:hypothetical protein